MRGSSPHTHVQWTSACWQAAHRSVQYRSDPVCRWCSSCSLATEPQIAHFQPSVAPPHFAHGAAPFAIPFSSIERWSSGPRPGGPGSIDPFTRSGP